MCVSVVVRDWKSIEHAVLIVGAGVGMNVNSVSNKVQEDES